MEDERKIFSVYLRDHFIFTLSVDASGRPHSAPVFYAFDESDGSLIFMSDPETIHGRVISLNPVCSGSIHDTIRDVGKIKGLQFSGKVHILNDGRSEKTALYMKNYPEADKIFGAIYVFQIEWMKMTDNTVFFGFKREWGNDPYS